MPRLIGPVWICYPSTAFDNHATIIRHLDGHTETSKTGNLNEAYKEKMNCNSHFGKKIPVTCIIQINSAS